MVILHCLHDFLDAVGADDLGHRSDHEGLTWLEKDHGAREADHLTHYGISTHTTYLARHYRRNMVGSLPRGMPKVVDYRQTGAQATNKMVTQDGHEVLSRFSRREGVIPTPCV